MENLEKLLSTLPKNKLSRSADIKIKFSLYRLILQNRLAKFFDFSVWHLSTSNKAWAFGLFLLLILGTTSFYAYASNDILPGSQLYPVKIALEKIEQKMTPNNSAKIANLEKFSERRLSEAVSLSQKEQKTTQEAQRINEDIKKNIAAEVSNHEAVVGHLNQLADSPKAQSLINEAKTNDQKEIKYLDRIAAFAVDNKHEDILQNVQAAREIINNQDYNKKENKQQDKTKPDRSNEEIKINDENISSTTPTGEPTTTPEIKNEENGSHRRNRSERQR